MFQRISAFTLVYFNNFYVHLILSFHSLKTFFELPNPSSQQFLIRIELQWQKKSATKVYCSFY